MTVSIMLTVNYHVFIACIKIEVKRTEPSSLKKKYLCDSLSYYSLRQVLNT